MQKGCFAADRDWLRYIANTLLSQEPNCSMQLRNRHVEYVGWCRRPFESYSTCTSIEFWSKKYSPVVLEGQWPFRDDRNVLQGRRGTMRGSCLATTCSEYQQCNSSLKDAPKDSGYQHQFSHSWTDWQSIIQALVIPHEVSTNWQIRSNATGYGMR